MCHYNSNTMLIRPLKSKSDNKTLLVCNELYKYLQNKEFEIKLHVMDNEALKVLKRQITKDREKYQLVELYNNHNNAIE